MRYVSRYLGHDAIRIAILVYRVSQCLDLQQQNVFIVNTPESFLDMRCLNKFDLMMAIAIYIYMPRYTAATTICAECAGR